jgi:hypothetical protein
VFNVKFDHLKRTKDFTVPSNQQAINAAAAALTASGASKPLDPR